MTDMGIRESTAHLGTSREESIILMERDIIFRDRSSEARPACTRVKFIERRVQWYSADDIDIDARSFIIIVFIIEWVLGISLLSDRILKRSKLCLEFFFGREFCHRCGKQSSSRRNTCFFRDVMIVCSPYFFLIFFPS